MALNLMFFIAFIVNNYFYIKHHDDKVSIKRRYKESLCRKLSF